MGCLEFLCLDVKSPFEGALVGSGSSAAWVASVSLPVCSHISSGDLLTAFLLLEEQLKGQKNLTGWSFWMVPTLYWQYHVLLPAQCCGFSAQRLSTVKKSKGGGVCATLTTGLSVLQTEVLYFGFQLGPALLLAAPGGCHPGMCWGWVNSPSHLRCVVVLQQSTCCAVFVAPHCTRSHFSLKC